MSRIRIVSTGLIGLALSTLGAAGPQAPTTQPSREQILEAKIRNQENIIATLEASLKAANDRARDADIRSARMERQLTAFQQRPAMPDPKIVPPEWKQQKFNGMTVYLVPCDTTSGPVPARAATAAK